MTILRKKILSFKIQKIIENDFVFFFQHNNIKNKEWVLLRLYLLYVCKDTCMYVCKNKLLNHTSGAAKHLNTVERFSCLRFSYSEGFNNGELLHKKALLDFLCQGPTVIVACNSINECKNICEIFAIFKRNVYTHHKFSHKALNFIHKKFPAKFTVPNCFAEKDLSSEKTVTGTDVNVENSNISNSSIPKKDLEHSNSSLTLEINTSTTDLPIYLGNAGASSLNQEPVSFSVETQTSSWKQQLEKTLPSCLNVNINKVAREGKGFYSPQGQRSSSKGFFFIGGYMQKRFVDFSDLKKIYKTNEFIYSNLITQICRPIQSLCLLSSVKTRDNPSDLAGNIFQLKKCFAANFLYKISANNLITILQIRKKKA